jgi:hypothetical protein
LSDQQKRLLEARAVTDTSFVAYFEAYYQGKFVDRMGTKYDVPKVSTTIGDADITAAENVLLEFLIDAIDSTPVMGDAQGVASVSDTTKFYPGGSTNVPTVYVVTHVNNPSIYAFIPTPSTAAPDDACGITTANAWVLKDLANGASDEAAAVGGLVAVLQPGPLPFVSLQQVGSSGPECCCRCCLAPWAVVAGVASQRDLPKSASCAH